MTTTTLTRTALLLGVCACIGALASCHGAGMAGGGAHVSMGERGDARGPSDTAEPVVRSRGEWASGSDSGVVLRTEHYNLYTSLEQERKRERIAAFLEDALKHYRIAIVPLPEPGSRMDTYVLDNRRQWERITLRLLGKDGENLLQLMRGGFASRGIGVYHDIGMFGTLSLAAHEGWHQYTQKTFPQPLPVWLEEGIATYMEGHKWAGDTPAFLPWANVERFNRLRHAVGEGETMSIDSLLSFSPSSALTTAGHKELLDFYAHAWALVHFLREGEGGRYREALRSILIDASTGNLEEYISAQLGGSEARKAVAERSGPAVMIAYINPDLDALNREYQGFLERVTAPGVRNRIVNGRSPITPD